MSDVKLRYDRAGRSEGVAFVSYNRVDDANAAIREFDGANAKGQPIRLTLLPPPRRDNPFDRVENPRSLFDRIEAPRDRRRSESPRSADEDYRRGPRRGIGRDRRGDSTRGPPENIDRYTPGQNGGRSDSRRGGRRPGERRERERRPRTDDGGHKLVGGRPRKTQEELDAEMEDYWGGANAGEGGQSAGGTNTGAAAPAPTGTTNTGTGEEIDMMVE